MKSTSEQTAKRRELDSLVERLGNLAWMRYPEIDPIGIIASKYVPVIDPSIVDYDEFFVLQYETKTIPAKQTDGKIFLRFRRRVTRDRKRSALWHVWEPGYAATKPETVDELLPIVRAHVASLTP